jgi:Cu2+-exporting ATPase
MGARSVKVLSWQIPHNAQWSPPVGIVGPLYLPGGRMLFAAQVAPMSLICCIRRGSPTFMISRGSTALPPVSVQGLRERDYDWLSHLAAEAESAEGKSRAELRLSVQGMSCVGCVWLLEKVFSKHPGTLTICVDVVQGELDLTWEPGRFDIVAFAREVQAFGYLLGPRNADAAPAESSGLARRTGTCGAFAMNAMAFSLPAYFGMPRDFPFARLFDLVAVMSATLAMLVGGSYFISRSWRSLRMGGAAHRYAHRARHHCGLHRINGGLVDE